MNSRFLIQSLGFFPGVISKTAIYFLFKTIFKFCWGDKYCYVPGIIQYNINDSTWPHYLTTGNINQWHFYIWVESQARAQALGLWNRKPNNGTSSQRSNPPPPLWTQWTSGPPHSHRSSEYGNKMHTNQRWPSCTSLTQLTPTIGTLLHCKNPGLMPMIIHVVPSIGGLFTQQTFTWRVKRECVQFFWLTLTFLQIITLSSL